MTRIAIVADIHHGPASTTKRGDRALALMEEVARFVAETRPDHMIDLGDRISDVDHATDLRLAREAADSFRAIDVPTSHICGNHDLDHLSVAENADILGQSLGHATIDLGDWRIALWRADARIRRGPEYRGFALTEPDLIWLANTARAADRPLLVVSHVPISGHSQIGNYYFQNNPASSVFPTADRARAALALASVPVICMSGHVHWNTITRVDGITHLTQQSLTESFTTEGEPAGAMGLLELGEMVHWEVTGGDPITHAWRPDARRWMPPLPDFRTIPEAHPRRALHEEMTP